MIIEIIDYSDEISEARVNAAEIHYQEGMILSEKQGIDIQKKAAKEIRSAMKYSPGYKNSEMMYEKCRLAVIKRV